jgi:hypothetical protein
VPFTLRNLKEDVDDVGSKILVMGAPNLSDTPREDVEGERGWWAD